MKLFIPSISDQIKLTKSWTFPLYAEYRNQSMIARVKPSFVKKDWYGSNNTASVMATFEAGTILKIARIYIRSGKSEWDSITFTVVSSPGDAKRGKVCKLRDNIVTVISPGGHSVTTTTKGEQPPSGQMKFKGGRFWAKLTDVNEIHCEIVQ